MNGQPEHTDRLECYEVLGIDQHAAFVEIEKAVQKLQLVHHADSRRAGAKPNTEILQM
jgi:curved DNA-binding protein CbpA